MSMSLLTLQTLLCPVHSCSSSSERIWEWEAIWKTLLFGLLYWSSIFKQSHSLSLSLATQANAILISATTTVFSVLQHSLTTKHNHCFSRGRNLSLRHTKLNLLQLCIAWVSMTELKNSKPTSEYRELSFLASLSLLPLHTTYFTMFNAERLFWEKKHSLDSLVVCGMSVALHARITGILLTHAIFLSFYISLRFFWRFFFLKPHLKMLCAEYWFAHTSFLSSFCAS